MFDVSRRSTERVLQVVRVLLALLLLLMLTGCERGCLRRTLGDHMGEGGEPEDPAPPRLRADHSNLDLSGTDCAGGLLRCIDSRVEASISAHRPHPCGAGAGNDQQAKCECPRESVARCSNGCALDGLEVVSRNSDAGATQLCRPDVPVARPLIPGDPVPADICSTEGVACVAGMVRSCEARGRPERGIAFCLNGCQTDVGVDAPIPQTGDPGAPQYLDGVVMILCRRDQAERR